MNHLLQFLYYERREVYLYLFLYLLSGKVSEKELLFRKCRMVTVWLRTVALLVLVA
ncbi:unnamed protein product [Larinioides sclopetarius]|uniref:Uncharacterized protein n=1 Tax=Larinioides sclopetarius TaxID=280406 RepID=A0AAV2B306_9ARAC